MGVVPLEGWAKYAEEARQLERNQGWRAYWSLSVAVDGEDSSNF
jgi:hypothetical protein